MRTIIYILTIITFIECNDSAKNPASNTDRLELIPEPDKNLREEYEAHKTSQNQDTIETTCTAMNFLKLKEINLQKEFLAKIDSIRKVQYPNNDQETEIMVDLTPKLLDQFLKDIDKDSFIQNRKFEKEYHFNIAPKGYSDPKECKDKISIEFYPNNCGYRMVIWDTFLVEPTWCTESQVIYSFEIKDDKIIDFRRNEAG